MKPLYALLNYFIERKRLLLWLTVALLVVLGISIVYRGGFENPKRTDLTVYLRAAEAIASGENIYAVQNDRGWNYVYLPLLAILLVPFTKIPLPLNVLGWYLLSVAAFFSTIRLSTALAPEPRRGFLITLAAAAFSFPALLNTAARGQMGIFTVFFAVFVFVLYLKRHVWWAGFLLSFIVALKIAPLAPLFLYFLIKKEWKICLAGFLGILFFVWVFPIITLGADRNQFLLSEWFRVLGHATSDSGHESVLWAQVATPFAADNQSLYAALTRWVWPSQENFIGHSNFWVRFAVSFFGAVSLLLMVLLTRQDQTPKSKARLLLEYSLFPLLMIFLSPVSEPHHYTVLFLSFLAACLTLEEISDNPKARAQICCGIGVAYSSFLVGLVSTPVSYWGVPVLGTFFFWGVLVFFLLTEKRSQS